MWCAARWRSEARSRPLAQRFANEVGDGGRQSETPRGVLRGGAEFAPSLPQDIDKLFARVIGVLGGEGGDFVFQKNEHGGILQGLRAGVGFEPGFGNPSGGFGGFCSRYAGFEQQGAGALGLFHVE